MKDRDIEGTWSSYLKLKVNRPLDCSYIQLIQLLISCTKYYFDWDLTIHRRSDYVDVY